MSMPGSFLGGARDRLLPASIPFRFFLSAALFQVLAWAVLGLAAGDVAGFRGGPGPTLAAIHLATLGVLAMTAIGASYQLLPVVTRRPLTRDWPPRLSFWLIFPGIGLLTFGMARAEPNSMMAGAVLVCLGLAVFALTTADNLRRAAGIPVVSAHGWLAQASMAIAALLGILLVWDFSTGFLDDHGNLAVIHMAIASFGFMGVLVLGFSLILIPMFVLSRSLPQRPGWAQLVLALMSLLLFSIGVWIGIPLLLWTSLAFALAATGCYLWLMHTALRTSMRKRLGLPFVLIRASWAFLMLSLLLACSLYAGLGIPNAPALTGFVILAGWLLTFLTGVLQRIMPFLASMHAADKSGFPPLLSDLTAERPLRIHAACHFAALAACITGILLEKVHLVQIGAALGTAGAISFGVFALNVVLQLGQPKPES